MIQPRHADFWSIVNEIECCLTILPRQMELQTETETETIRRSLTQDWQETKVFVKLGDLQVPTQPHPDNGDPTFVTNHVLTRYRESNV